MATSNVSFYRAGDGLLAICHIDTAGKLVQTQSTNITAGWSQIVAVP